VPVFCPVTKPELFTVAMFETDWFVTDHPPVVVPFMASRNPPALYEEAGQLIEVLRFVCTVETSSLATAKWESEAFAGIVNGLVGV